MYMKYHWHLTFTTSKGRIRQVDESNQQSIKRYTIGFRIKINCDSMMTYTHIHINYDYVNNV